MIDKILNNWIHFISVMIMMSCSSDNNFEHKVLSGSGSVLISNQEELIDFGMLGYTKIEKPLHIRGVSDLSPLSSLLEVNSLDIRETNLINFDGLQNLEKINSLFIVDNTLLEDISGLKYTEISRSNVNGNNEHVLESGSIIIRNNDALSNLNGLGKVKYLTSLSISENDSLLNLEGLSNLELLSYEVSSDCEIINGYSAINIYDNDALINLKGLEKAQTEVLIIEENQSLINLEGLSSIVNLSSLIITGNRNLKSLQGLNNLTGVYNKGCQINDMTIRINWNSSLTDYCSLSSIRFNNTDNETFDISGNIYNPTYYQIITENGCSE